MSQKRTTASRPGADAAASTAYNVLVPYAYNHRGEQRTGWTSAGVAFRSRDGEGFNLEIRPGISISGRVIVRPWATTKEAAGDVAPPEPSSPGHFVYDPQLPKEKLV